MIKVSVDVRSHFASAHYWSLVVENDTVKKSFYLGQDVKVCQRLLGAPPEAVVERLGTKDIMSPKGNQKLVELILERILPEEEEIESLLDFPAWEFAVE